MIVKNIIKKIKREEKEKNYQPRKRVRSKRDSTKKNNENKNPLLPSSPSKSF